MGFQTKLQAISVKLLYQERWNVQIISSSHQHVTDRYIRNKHNHNFKKCLPSNGYTVVLTII